jgi:hypothetical protein
MEKSKADAINEYFRLAGEKAKPLFEIKKNGQFIEQVVLLKKILEDNGLKAGILEIRITCENKENKKDSYTTIASTGAGSVLLHREYFNL